MLAPQAAWPHAFDDRQAGSAAQRTARALIRSASETAGERTAQSAVNFELVGHEPLYARGMNAAPAIYGHHVYVGNRTDGTPGHPHPGVLVVDVADPSQPAVVGEIGPPDEGNIGETSRELRVLPDQGLLAVMNFGCSALIHACVSAADVVGTLAPTIKFYDLAANPADPPLVATYRPSRTPHEMFLWVDPLRPGRALLYMSTPTSSTTRPNLIVTDVSQARLGIFPEVVQWIGNDQFSAGDRATSDVRLHSMGVSPDGTRTYLAYLGGGFLVLDTSDLANAAPSPQIRLATPIENRLHWGDPGAHSAVEVAGRPLALVTDEVYGDLLDPITGANHGCPWGWVRVIDIADEAHPAILGEYRLAQNQPAYCESADGQDPLNTYFTSYSSHNPTLVGDLAFVTWHSAGLQAFSIADPAAPAGTGSFVPEPLDLVATEDPALSLGRNRVVAWSYPIVRDGLIYIVDVRNGLYVLRYTGPGADRVAAVSFLEGNSNLGDAAALDAAP
jgi:hypothetical protein